MNKRPSDNIDNQGIQRIGSNQRPANLNIAIDFKKRRPEKIETVLSFFVMEEFWKEK